MHHLQTRINLAVRTKLLGSGHYLEKPNGQIASAHLTGYQFVRGYLGYPELIAGRIEDIKLGTLPAHGDIVGVESYVRIEEPDKPPIYLVDNHQGAYFAWLESLELGDIKSEATLVHIDMHQDSEIPFSWPTDTNLTAASKFLMELRVEDFILPLVIDGSINQFWYISAAPYGEPEPLNNRSAGSLQWTTESARATFTDHPLYDRSYDKNVNRYLELGQILARLNNPNKGILDIDLDAFVRHNYPLSGLPTEKSFDECCSFIADIAKHFGVITIATSPGFADQKIAIMLARKMVREILAKK